MRVNDPNDVEEGQTICSIAESDEERASERCPNLIYRRK